MTLKPIHFIIAAVLAFVCLAFFASGVWAQDAAPVIAPSSIWYDLWTIVQPVVVLIVSTVGPVLGGWISFRIIGLLKVTDEKQRVEIETKLNAALHQSALNAMKYAFTKAGLPQLGGLVDPSLMAEAVAYVTEKNPDALNKLGVDRKALEEIILSKIPEVVQAAK
ncbi:hypothetical protein [Agrobacterium rubi]|uniref:hypothetical protein n=1 Tax=Agrobacterium rubi TaxID=28099 RepID=UPI00157471D2|nr:hypothetical protein [Agrobacterium rubi]NTE87181.1 hypothetical protein [Agrobacterium rubi]NTF03115.1 hypothetical protein [Agrobacterium rubi]